MTLNLHFTYKKQVAILTPSQRQTVLVGGTVALTYTWSDKRYCIFTGSEDSLQIESKHVYKSWICRDIMTKKIKLSYWVKIHFLSDVVFQSDLILIQFNVKYSKLKRTRCEPQGKLSAILISP